MKTSLWPCFVSGHDFSRAVKPFIFDSALTLVGAAIVKAYFSAASNPTLSPARIGTAKALP
jgi:hypothetical protein